MAGRGGSKITFTKCFRLFTQHLSSSLCHSSGTKELARQTMLLRQKEKKKGRGRRREEEEKRRRRRDTNKSASGGESSEAPGGVRVMVLVIWCQRRSSDWCCRWGRGPHLSWSPKVFRYWWGSSPGAPLSRWPARACDTATLAWLRLF